MSAIVEITTEDWEQRILASPEPMLVDFRAPWCAPCEAIAPLVEEIAERYAGRLTVATIDVDVHPAPAARLGVLSLPTLIAFSGGEPVDRVVGAVGRERLEKMVESALDP